MRKRNSFLLFTFSLSLVLMSPLMVYAQVSGEPYNPYQVPVDQSNNINSVLIPKTGLSTEFQRSTISRENISYDKFPLDKKSEPIPDLPQSKISPTLEKLLLNSDPSEGVEVIITFKEDINIPLLPELEAGVEREKSKRRKAAIAKLQAQRVESQLALLERYKISSYFEPREHFWIVNAVAGKTQFSAVKEIAQLDAVAYIQPVQEGEKPPDAITNNDVDDGRAIIVSDPYFNLGLTQPWIGLLDTGVRNTHVLFDSPSNLAWLRDCVNGGTNCNNTANPGYNTDDNFWDHGTSSAAIISGNGRLGDAYRGVTGVKLDSWKIYPNGGLDSAAAIRAIQAGVAAFDKVLVGELQASETESGAIATAADNAYNAGVIFVSANGNYGPDDRTVRSPAIAHKVIGVGGVMTTDQSQYNNQGRGPATDGRIKPDIQAPTYSETASNASSSALQVFGGTSGATPYASGVAMLAHNWLRQFGTYDNGQTYAFMILYGQKAYPYNNTSGAGVLKMATNGWAHWGKVVVNNGTTIDIPISVGSGKQDFDAALWWPESAAQAHNDIDVHIIDPSGVEKARGYSALSVFERARVAGTLTPGTWKVRIRGYSVPTGGQVVYWAAHIRN